MLPQEAPKYCNLSLLGDSGQSSEAENDDKSSENKDKDQEVSVGNKDSIGSWTRGYVC